MYTYFHQKVSHSNKYTPSNYLNKNKREIEKAKIYNNKSSLGGTRRHVSMGCSPCRLTRTQVIIAVSLACLACTTLALPHAAAQMERAVTQDPSSTASNSQIHDIALQRLNNCTAVNNTLEGSSVESQALYLNMSLLCSSNRTLPQSVRPEIRPDKTVRVPIKVDEHCCQDFKLAESKFEEKKLSYDPEELFNFICGEELSSDWKKYRRQFIDEHIDLISQGLDKLRIQPENVPLFHHYRQLFTFIAQRLPEWFSLDMDQKARDLFIFCALEDFTNGEKDPFVRCVNNMALNSVQQWLSDPNKDKNETIRQMDILHKYLQVIGSKEIFAYGAINGIPPEGSDVASSVNGSEFIPVDEYLEDHVDVLAQALADEAIPYDRNEVRNYLNPANLSERWIKIRGICVEKHLRILVYSLSMRDPKGNLTFDNFKMLLTFYINFPYWNWKRYAWTWSCDPNDMSSWNIDKGCYSISSERHIENCMEGKSMEEEALLLDHFHPLVDLNQLTSKFPIEDLLALKKRNYIFMYYSKAYPGLWYFSLEGLQDIIAYHQSLSKETSVSEENTASMASPNSPWTKNIIDLL